MARRPAVVVLAYHGLSERWPVETAVTPERFERQLSSLVRRGFSGATFTEAISTPPARPTLVVTFDDATQSVREHALPVLRRLGLLATVFVPTSFATSGRSMAWSGQEEWVGTEHEPELRCLSWDELGEMASLGWEIGSHTRSHPRLTTLGDDDLAEELGGSKADCEERLGMPCRSIAYPYSDYDDRVVEASRKAGYEAAATVPREARPASPLEWPRVGVYRRDDARRLRARIWRRGTIDGSPLERGVDRALTTIQRVRSRSA